MNLKIGDLVEIDKKIFVFFACYITAKFFKMKKWRKDKFPDYERIYRIMNLY